jgi:phage terminase large subunit-like protein
MTSGSGTRREPLVVAITTAGFDLEGTLCGMQYEYGKRVKRGEVDDPSFYFKWYEPTSPECDYRDPQVWAECNPALGDFLYLEDLADRARTQPEYVFRRYGLNQWTQTEEAWIPYGVWEQGESDLGLDSSLPLYVGIDLAKTVDSSALVMCQKHTGAHEDDPVTYVVRALVWENPYPEGHTLHDSWRMNNNDVIEVCRALYAQYPVAACEIDGEIMPGPMFAYDPWRFRPEAEGLYGEGLAMMEFPQSDSRMIPASQDFYEAIMKNEIAHDGDVTLKRHIHNVTAEQKPRGWRMAKPKGSTRKIDAAIACGIAVHCAKVTVPPDGRSYYEDHDIRVLGGV